MARLLASSIAALTALGLALFGSATLTGCSSSAAPISIGGPAKSSVHATGGAPTTPSPTAPTTPATTTRTPAALSPSPARTSGPVATTPAPSPTKAVVGSVPKKCPTAAKISTAAATSLPAHKATASAGTLLCAYDNTTTGVSVDFVYAVQAGLSTAVLRGIAGSQATAQKATAKPVARLGQAAYGFVTKAAAGSPASADLLVLIGRGVFVSVVGQLSLTHLEAVARVAIR